MTSAASFDSDDDWTPSTLGDVLIERSDVLHPTEGLTGEAVFVGLEHIEPNTGLRIGQLDVDLKNLSGRKPRFRKGDILYGYLRPYLNKVWVAEFDGLCSVEQYVFEVNQELAVTDFIAWFMRSPMYLERAPIDESPGQLPRIRREEVSSVKLLLPPRDVQQEIADRLNHQMAAFVKARVAAQAQLDAVNALPAALLRRGFEGL